MPLRPLRLFSLPGLIALPVGLIVAFMIAPEPARADERPSPSTSSSSTLIVKELGKGAVPLDGLWQFHLGDDPSWAAEAFDDSAKNGWEEISADRPWGEQGHESYVGYAWYRRHISVTSAAGSSSDFALMFPRVEDAYEVYWNGRLIGKDGKLPPHAMWYQKRLAQTFGLGPIRDGVLAVRVWKSPLGSVDPGTVGGIEATPLIGSSDAIAASKNSSDFEWIQAQQFTFGLSFLYFLAGFISLLAWLLDRRQWLLLGMAGFALGYFLQQIFSNFPLSLSFHWSMGPDQPLIGLTNAALWLLLLLLLELNEVESLKRFLRIAIILEIALNTIDGLAIFNWATGFDWQMQLASAIVEGLTSLIEFCPLVLVVAAIRRGKKLDASRWAVAAFAFANGMFYTVGFGALFGVRFTHWTLAERMVTPLFTLHGNPIGVIDIVSTLLFVSIVYAVIEYSAKNRHRQMGLEQEFRQGRELQRILIPEKLPEIQGFAMTCAYRPAQEIGGDFFQVIPIDSDTTLILLGDVSGKGLRAAMTVSWILGAARMLVEQSSNPAEILAGLNRQLCGRVQVGFTTAIALRLDRNGCCFVATAGHPAPFLNQSELDLPGALPLGIMPDTEYEETAIALRTGDYLMLYTDGLLEARSRDGELYGFERIKTLFASHPDATHAMEAAVDFGQDDDITVLTLTRLAAGEEPSAIHGTPTLSLA